MPKKINSHRDLSIRWRKETHSYTLDLQPIGGTRQSFASKAEATIAAKRMFEIFETGKPFTELRPWTVEKAVSEYLKHAKNRAEDPDARDPIPIKMKSNDPVGLLMFGDIHVDSPQCNWPELDRCVAIAIRGV